MNAPRRRFLLFATTVAAIAGLAGIAAPAAAQPAGDEVADSVCWIDTDTDAVQCFDSDAEFEQAVAEQTGTVVVYEGDVAGRSAAGAGLLATYVIGEFYEGTYYTGVKYNITSTSTTICTTGAGKSGNMPSGANNTISSVRSYYSCVTRLYDLTGQGGTYSAWLGNAPTLGSMDNLASSYRLM